MHVAFFINCDDNYIPLKLNLRLLFPFRYRKAIFIGNILLMKALLPYLLFAFALGACQPLTQQDAPTAITPGVRQTDVYLPLLAGKTVALVVNNTSTLGPVHLVDSLLSLGIEVRTIFAPEHGFRGDADAGEKIADSIDPRTGIPIISLYGKHRKPTEEDLADIEVVVFDIQDVGVRFYTYISTLHYVMDACAEFNKPLILLDRPNPNGHYVAGPVLEPEFKSFVGMHPIPVVYGLTLGELAQMINGEGWLANGKCDLQVIKINNYTHNDHYTLPVKPSPNLPNAQAIALYPSLCFFEPTVMSIGRGTPYPFQVIGYPDPAFGNFSFTPVSIEGMSKYPKHQNRTCYGVDLRKVAAPQFTLSYLMTYYTKFGGGKDFFTSANFFDKLAGSSLLRQQILQGLTAAEIEKTWVPQLDAFKETRKKYLLYPDFE